MIAKSCPKCESQVAVASKSCKCGHTFFASRRAADNLPAVEDIKRRTGRVRRSQPQFYDAQHYDKQIKKRSPKKRSLSRSLEEDNKTKEKSETATARARRRRALRRAQRTPAASTSAGAREPTPQLRPAQLARCQLILHEINRKMTAVMWQPPADLWNHDNRQLLWSDHGSEEACSKTASVDLVSKTTLNVSVQWGKPWHGGRVFFIRFTWGNLNRWVENQYLWFSMSPSF